MRKISWISILVALGGGWVSACNLNHHAAQSQASASAASSAYARHLRLQLVVGDGAIENVPGDHALGWADGDLNQQGDVVSIEKRLALPDLSQGENPLYFTWSDAWSGSTIIGATYDLEQINDQGRVKDLANGQGVERDAATGRWFVSLSRLFAGHEFEINPLDQQILTLNFVCADGSSVSTQVRFNLDGLIPDHFLQSDTLTGLEAALNTPADASSSYTYEVSRVVNSTRRPLVVWARVASVSVSVMTWISQEQLAFDSKNNRAQVSGFDHYFSQATLAPAGFTASLATPFTASLESTFLAASSGEWASVTVAPGASLQLSWQADPLGQSNRCQLPVPQSVVVFGCHWPDRSLGGGLCEVTNGFGSTRPAIETQGVAHWNVEGRQFVADVSRDLQVLEVGESPESQNLSPKSTRSLIDSQTTAHGVNTDGTPVPGAGVFAECAHGVFY
jgi:hypothetical protein